MSSWEIPPHHHQWVFQRQDEALHRAENGDLAPLIMLLKDGVHLHEGLRQFLVVRLLEAAEMSGEIMPRHAGPDA